MREHCGKHKKKVIFMGNSELSHRIIFFETHLRLTLILCCYAGSNVAPLQPKIRHGTKIFTLIHVSYVLARTTACAFLAGIKFSMKICFLPLRGWSKEENEKTSVQEVP